MTVGVGTDGEADGDADGIRQGAAESTHKLSPSLMRYGQHSEFLPRSHAAPPPPHELHVDAQQTSPGPFSTPLLHSGSAAGFSTHGGPPTSQSSALFWIQYGQHATPPGRSLQSFPPQRRQEAGQHTFFSQLRIPDPHSGSAGDGGEGEEEGVLGRPMRQGGPESAQETPAERMVRMQHDGPRPPVLQAGPPQEVQEVMQQTFERWMPVAHVGSLAWAVLRVTMMRKRRMDTYMGMRRLVLRPVLSGRKRIVDKG